MVEYDSTKSSCLLNKSLEYCRKVWHCLSPLISGCSEGYTDSSGTTKYKIKYKTKLNKGVLTNSASETF